MEILGLVWAASIFNSFSPMVAAMASHGRQPQPQAPIPVESTAAWFDSLAQVYGWPTETLAPRAAFNSYALSTTWVIPRLSPLAPLPGASHGKTADFSPLFPIIGPELSNFEPPVAVIPAESMPEDFEILGQWHQWDAIAAVRIMAPTAPVEAEAPVLEVDPQCLEHSPVRYQASPIAMQASPRFQIWVHNHFIGEVSGQVSAERMARTLRSMIQKQELDPNQLQPLFGAHFAGGSLGSEIVFVVDETLRSHPEIPAAAVAVQWVNNLRVALDVAPLDLGQIHMAMEGLVETSAVLYGTASWYGPGFHGRKTANGERFDQNAFTAAHKTLPFNTYLKVTNRLNGKSVVVRINDRGPYVGNRTLDLSRAAARCLGSTGKGVVPYEAVVLNPVSKPQLDELTTAKLVVQD